MQAIGLRDLLIFSGVLSASRTRLEVSGLWSRLVHVRSRYVLFESVWRNSAYDGSADTVARCAGALAAVDPRTTVLIVTNYGCPPALLVLLARTLPLCLVYDGMSGDLHREFKARGIDLLCVAGMSLLAAASAVERRRAEGSYVVLKADAASVHGRARMVAGCQARASPLLDALQARRPTRTVELFPVLSEMPPPDLVMSAPVLRGREPGPGLASIDALIERDPLHYDWRMAGLFLADVRVRVRAAAFLSDAADFLAAQQASAEPVAGRR